MQVHVVQTGSLVGNATFMRGDGFGALLRRRHAYEFPAYAFVIEHPTAGLFAIDTGMAAGSAVPAWQRRFVPHPLPSQEIGPAMQRAGLDPREVSTVILTHLDWDHAGGLHHFPHARVIVQRSEWAFAQTRMGRARYQPQRWPATLRPDLIEGEEELLPGVHAVPLAGHSVGQIGVQIGDLLFCGDHVLREDWFREDLAEGRELGLGQFFPAHARETTRRLAAFTGTLVPSHDTDAPARIRASAASRSGTETPSAV